jgi:TonB family protein
VIAILATMTPTGWSEPRGVAGASQNACTTQPIEATVAVAPRFPEIARKARLSMTIPVDVTISRSGRVTEAKLQAGTPDHLFLGQVSTQAATRWRFNEDRGCLERSATLMFAFRQPVPVGWGAGTIFKPPFLVEIVEEEIEVRSVS